MTFSFSRLNSFDNGCKYCWFEKYANKRQDGVQNAFAEYGTLIHEILERVAKGEIMLWDMLGEFEKGFAEVSQFPPLGKTNLREVYYRQGVEYLSEYKFHDRYEIVSVEEKVDTDINGLKFTGFIDELLRDKDDGKLVVLDHKSKSKFKSKKEQKEYARQLYLYAYAVKEKYGEYPKMLMFNMFRHQIEVPIFFNEKDLEEAIGWAHDIVSRIKVCDTFEVSNDRFFRSFLCDFRHEEEHQEGNFKTLEDWNRE